MPLDIQMPVEKVFWTPKICQKHLTSGGIWMSRVGVHHKYLVTWENQP